ncbi:NrtR DNA-binding winged helix domain-containing protein [Bacillus sp. 1P06AnD]|uniref:NrtR DNA-binding winged helix domain-containing protein n=1 Tax=Bacillus sp. 1P06AnD TaxID=3132208 RepID=UPI0039A362BD
MNRNETAFEAAFRILDTRMGLRPAYMKHIHIYDKPDDMEKQRVIYNAHYAIMPEHLLNRQETWNDMGVHLYTLKEIGALPIETGRLDTIKDAYEALAKDLLTTTAAKHFLPSAFTYSELQGVLMTICSDPAITRDQSFARKIKSLPFIEALKGQTTNRHSKKPTQLYCFNDLHVLKPIYTARY